VDNKTSFSTSVFPGGLPQESCPVENDNKNTVFEPMPAGIENKKSDPSDRRERAYLRNGKFLRLRTIVSMPQVY